MPEYVQSALFVYSETGQEYLEQLVENSHGTEIVALQAEHISGESEAFFADVTHVVVAAEFDTIKEVLIYAAQYQFGVGFLPLPGQKTLTRFYALPSGLAEQISLALESEGRPLDLVFCNDRLMLFNASIGHIPLFDSLREHSRLRMLWQGLRQIGSLQLLPFTIETHGSNKTSTLTAAAGCLIQEDTERSFASRVVAEDSSFEDGMVSTVIIAPFSVVDYLKLLWQRTFTSSENGTRPGSIGYIKSPRITIDSPEIQGVRLDGKELTTTPAQFRVEPGVVMINHGISGESGKLVGGGGKEKFSLGALPAGKELDKDFDKHIPFFTYASEERFKDLFVALRDDARLNSTYITLMVLSTVLASVGLYLNSVSVIIGAMLLAPLMAPIISLAMSLLRYDRKLFRHSFTKVTVGVCIALMTAMGLTLVSPYQPLSSEMAARLNPSVLDLIVAIVAGIAGAYTKSFKEILQSLAGVAIAVALVPPLAVAGIGLGRFDPSMFSQSFLLFTTNLIGIVLAATLTFRVLGYSPVVHDKRGVGVVVLFMLLLLIPLSFAFNGIVQRDRFEQSWQQQTIQVNDKSLLINKADLQTSRHRRLLLVEIHAREPLTGNDLSELKKKVQRNFEKELEVRVQIIYVP